MKNSAFFYGIALVAALLGAGAAHSQQATEVYIPIGESPGVSNVNSIMGTIENVDYSERSMQVRDRTGTRAVTMDDKTRYYVDSTVEKRSNRYGSLSDCQVGYYVEIKLRADGKVDWVKIKAT